MSTTRRTGAALALLLTMSGAGSAQETPTTAAPVVSSLLVGDVFTHEVQPGDTLVAIGARHGIDATVIARRNSRSATQPLAVGERLLLDNRHIVPGSASVSDAIVINIPQRMLFFLSEGRLRAWYPVGLGRPTWRTPVGSFTVLEKETDPTWDVPKSIQEEMRRAGKPVITSIPPCPANPLGKYWIRLSHPDVGIHGTNAPASIYQFQTHGCIRLHPDDVCALFALVSVGDRGRTVYQPALLAELPAGRVFVEVHRDVYQRGPDPMRYLRAQADRAQLTERIDWTRVAETARLREGLAVEVSRVPPESVTGR